MNILYKNILWALGALLIVSLIFSIAIDSTKPAAELSLNQLVQKINHGEVTSILVQGNDLTIALKDGTNAVAKKESEAGLTETLKNYGVESAALQSVSF